MARARPALQQAVNEILERHGKNDKRMSFRQAERLTGLSPATIGELAKGNARTPETIRRFARGLGEDEVRLLLLGGFVPEEVEALTNTGSSLSLPQDGDGSSLLPEEVQIRMEPDEREWERLAKEGIASFRFDKRSAATYADKWPKDMKKLDETFAWKAFLGDALAAYRLLRQQPEVEAKRVGILGHSEGGLIALNLAHDLAGKPEAPAAMVLVATSGRPLDAVVLEQMHALLPKQIPDKETLKTYLDYVDKAVPQVKKEKTLPPNTPQGLFGLFNPTVISLLHSYFTMDPITFAAKYSGPVLIVQGEKDTQVSAARDAPRLAEALKKRAGKVSELFLVPNASHNLKEVKSAEELGIAGPVVPAALDKIAIWFKSHSGASEPAK